MIGLVLRGIATDEYYNENDDDDEEGVNEDGDR